jgi:hypothetical protein
VALELDVREVQVGLNQRNLQNLLHLMVVVVAWEVVVLVLEVKHCYSSRLELALTVDEPG